MDDLQPLIHDYLDEVDQKLSRTNEGALLARIVDQGGIAVYTQGAEVFKERWKSARVCRPAWTKKGASSGKWPLHMFQHGDEGAGAALSGYFPVIEDIAAHGFNVAAQYSCEADKNPATCESSRASWLETLKVLAFLHAKGKVESTIEI